MLVVDITDPADRRLDDLRDLNHSDRRPDLPGGRGLVIAEGTYVVGRMLLSRFRPHLLLGTDARLQQLRREAAAEGWDADERAGDAVYLRTTKDGRTALLAYSALDRLTAGAGDVPWALMTVPDLQRVHDETAYDVLYLDVRIPEQHREL